MPAIIPTGVQRAVEAPMVELPFRVTYRARTAAAGADFYKQQDRETRGMSDVVSHHDVGIHLANLYFTTPTCDAYDALLRFLTPTWCDTNGHVASSFLSPLQD